MKKLMVFLLAIACVAALAGCAGAGSLSVGTDEETGAYVVNADNAAEGSTVASVGGGINVEKGQILVVSPDLRKGAMQLQLVNVRGETVFDEKVSGHVLDTYEIPVDTYSLVASCAVNGTTGTLTVVPLDKKEWEKHSDTLQETLDRMDQSLKDALGNVGIAVG